LSPGGSLYRACSDYGDYHGPSSNFVPDSAFFPAGSAEVLIELFPDFCVGLPGRSISPPLFFFGLILPNDNTTGSTFR